jgi:hypothetical protein
MGIGCLLPPPRSLSLTLASDLVTHILHASKKKKKKGGEKRQREPHIVATQRQSTLRRQRRMQPEPRTSTSTRPLPCSDACAEGPDRRLSDASLAAVAAAKTRLRLGRGFELDATLQGSYPPSSGDECIVPTNVGDLFGFGVAAYGDKLFVGAPTSSVRGHDASGASYFYRRNPDALPGTAWQQSQPPFSLPVDRNAMGAGRYAAGDGWLFVPTIGTPDDAPGCDDKDFSGELLVFRNGDEDCEGAWTLFQKIANPAGAVDGRGQLFGFNASYSRGRLLAAGVPDSNRAYVFERDAGSGTWSQVAVLDLPGGDVFILDVLISGEWAFVGFARQGTSGGAVAVFKSFGNDPCDCTMPGWRLIQTLTGFDNKASGRFDLFGEALAIDGSTLAVGAPTDATRNPGGAVYIFQLCDGRWLSAQKIYDSASSEHVLGGSYFGYKLALQGDVLAVAEPFRNVSGTLAQGAVALYARDSCSKEWLPTGDLLVDPDGFATELFGAGAVVLTDGFLFASNNLSPLFLDSPIDPQTGNPGRVVVWRRLHEEGCWEAAEKGESRKRHHHHRKHC